MCMPLPCCHPGCWKGGNEHRHHGQRLVWPTGGAVFIRCFWHSETAVDACRTTTPLGHLGLGAASGLLASSLCFPLDTVRRQMQMRQCAYRNQWHAMSTVWRQARRPTCPFHTRCAVLCMPDLAAAAWASRAWLTACSYGTFHQKWLLCAFRRASGASTEDGHPTLPRSSPRTRSDSGPLNCFESFCVCPRRDMSCTAQTACTVKF